MSLFKQKTGCLAPSEKATDKASGGKDIAADGGLRPPSAGTVRERSSLTGFTFLVAFVCVIGINAIYDKGVRAAGVSENENTESQPMGQGGQELKDKYDALQKDFQALSMDRDNLINQAKLLLNEKSKAREFEDALAKEKSDRALAVKEKEEIQGVLKDLEDKHAALKDAQGKLEAQKQELEDDLAKERDKSWVKKITDEKTALQKENGELKLTLKETQAALAKLKERGTQADKALVKAEAELAQLRDTTETLTKDYQEAVKKNKLIEQRAFESPKKFVELAHQNKTLIKQTGNMHYNLGVFYSKHKEYSRAVSEFEEAVKLRPDDAYSHFNLGYIYAEYLVNRPKAIEHFRHYLRLAKKDDKDLDWVKKYILTWQAWAGKEPME